MGSIYGTAMPMQRRMEMGILSQVGRLPGLPSSHLGLNTVLGRDETIDWEDYLGCALRPRPHCCSTASPHSPAARPPHLSRRRDRARGRGVDEGRRGLQATPLSARLSVPENSEVAVDMRAQLERKYGITPQSSALGPAALGARGGRRPSRPAPLGPDPPPACPL